MMRGGLLRPLKAMAANTGTHVIQIAPKMAKPGDRKLPKAV
jgi:hypothetical protein